MRARVLPLVAVLLAVTACDKQMTGTLPPEIVNLEVTPRQQTIEVGDSADFEAQATTSGGMDISFQWSSQDTSIATVDSTGTAYGKSEGETVIIVTANPNTENSASKGASLTVAPDTTGGS